MKIEVRGIAAIGTVLSLDKQDYRLTAHRPHKRQDGSTTHLMVWVSTCPKCGEAFEALTSTMERAPARRCEPCRKVMGATKVKGGGRVVAVMTLPDASL